MQVLFTNIGKHNIHIFTIADPKNLLQQNNKANKWCLLHKIYDNDNVDDDDDDDDAYHHHRHHHRCRLVVFYSIFRWAEFIRG